MDYILSWVVGLAILVLPAWGLVALGLGVWPSCFIVFTIFVVVRVARGVR